MAATISRKSTATGCRRARVSFFVRSRAEYVIGADWTINAQRANADVNATIGTQFHR
jgi:hypothetical protein